MRLPRALGHPASYGEPDIVAGPRGLLLVDAARANVGFPTWWISRTDGRSWGPGRDYDTSGSLTGDDDGMFGSGGYLYVLNLAFKNPPQQPANPTIRVYASRGGRHWSGPARFPPPHGLDQPDRPWLVPDPYRPNRVYLTNSEGAGDVVLWTSTDHAHSFTGPVPITGAQHASAIELSSRPLFDPVDHSRMFMLYVASTAADAGPPHGQRVRDFPVSQLWLAESADSGRTWSNRLVLDITRAFGAAGRGGSLGHVLPALAVDQRGGLYAVFSLRLGDGSQTHIFLMHSTDHGRRWSRPVQVDERPFRSNVMPTLVAGLPGRVDLSWYASRAADFTDAHARWVEMFAQSLDALSARPVFSVSRIGGVTHVGSIDTAGNPGSYLYNWNLRDFQGLTIDGCGRAHVVWTNDLRTGYTAVARQLAGPSLLGAHRCR